MNFEKINKTNCRIDNIQNNDNILIGGSSFDLLNLIVVADIEHFEDFFQKVEKKGLEFENNKGMHEWLKKIAPDFDAKSFAHMFAFDNVLRKMYPNMSSNISKRDGYYSSEEPKKLSQSFNDGVCKCAEIAILAQAYLQRQGFESKYFLGEVLNSPDDEFGEAHCFISMKIGNEDYFYDPANPTFDSIFNIPKISSIEATPAQKKQFENKIHSTSERRNCAFLEAKDIFTKTSCYYGCGDGANILPSFIISKNNIVKSNFSENSL